MTDRTICSKTEKAFSKAGVHSKEMSRYTTVRDRSLTGCFERIPENPNPRRAASRRSCDAGFYEPQDPEDSKFNYDNRPDLRLVEEYFMFVKSADGPVASPQRSSSGDPLL